MSRFYKICGSTPLPRCFTAITGGAAATRGKVWHRICLVEGFPSETAALQFEWRWKNATKQFRLLKGSLERRLKALEYILSLDKTTSKAVPYSEWPSTILIHWEEIDGIGSL